MEKLTNLKGLTLSQLEEKMESMGQPAFRGRQLFRWIYQARESDFDKMTDLQKGFREFLKQHFELPKVSVVEARPSSDGTIKYLVGLKDGHKVESVFIPMEGRNTLCVSTQVGCKMACSFCATGYMKFGRNLETWEIVDQFLSLPFPDRVTNIVFMGMGEPFDNYDESIKALQILEHPMGPQIGKRHVTVSTVGITSKIQDFIEKDLGKIAISLHGTTDEQRSQIMPINKRYPLAELIKACQELVFKHRDRVTFEYVLLKDFNDSNEDAVRLAKLLRAVPCKINLLAYNENPYIDFKRPSEERILTFQNILLGYHHTVTYRRSRGRDVAGACGQLHTEIMRRPHTASHSPASLSASPG